MGTYLANNSCCFDLSAAKESEISIEERIILVRQDGTEVETYSHFIEGETYTAKRIWIIINYWKEIARFETKEEAEKEYNRILKELSIKNTVVRL